MRTVQIDAKGMHYKELNELINQRIGEGARRLELLNVNGQRYIGTGCTEKEIEIKIHGVPGNDLGIFMDGPSVEVFANAQDGVGTTMNSGLIAVHGDAGDVLGYGMRGGRVYVRGSVGYRVGIHMKGFMDMIPVMIAGGTAGNFCAEYMAGGVMIVLGLDSHGPAVGDYFGTGMHGGVVYVRGSIDKDQVGKEVKIFDVDEKDRGVLSDCLKPYCDIFKLPLQNILKSRFSKIIPVSSRPYGKMYAY